MRAMIACHVGVSLLSRAYRLACVVINYNTATRNSLVTFYMQNLRAIIDFRRATASSDIFGLLHIAPVA